jgi:1,4-dihydroxy-2-naphthoyl-CoA hydrolase
VAYKIDFFQGQFSVIWPDFLKQNAIIQVIIDWLTKTGISTKIMGIFREGITIEKLNTSSHGNMVGHLGIRYTEIGEDFLVGTMPVDERTIQPMGLLHGGASVALAETLGSVASLCCIDMSKFSPVGLEINANHIKSARSGLVTGVAKALHIGNRTHVWEIKITNENNELVCASRITMAIIERK